MATSKDIDLTRGKGVNICSKIKPGKNKNGQKRSGVNWRISRHQQLLNELRGVSLLGIRQDRGELGRVLPFLGSLLSPTKSVIP
jgi:hypothetical protein